MRIRMLTVAHVIGTVNVVSILAIAPVIQGGLAFSATEVDRFDGVVIFRPGDMAAAGGRLRG